MLNKGKRKILIGICLLIQVHLIHSQDWPVGTTWVYEQYEFLWPYPYNYIIFRISGDTVIQNQNAKILEEFYWDSTRDSTQIKSSIDTYYIRTNAGKVDFWNLDSARFELIYDFNVHPSDTIDLYVGPRKSKWDSVKFTKYVVDNEDYVETSMGNKKIKYLQRVESNGDCYIYGGSIIDEIGSDAYFFQQYCIADPGYGGKLVCFTNGIFNYPKDYVCKIPTGNQNLSEFPPVIYPNPANDFITIRNLPYSESEVSLYNQLGQMFNCTRMENKLDIGELPSGVYILKIKNKDLHFNFKIIKE
jgi:hypothetical protein